MVSKTVADSRVETVHIVRPNHLNGAGRLFGGILMQWIDEVAGIVAKHGAYVRFRSDFGSVSADLECDDTGALTSGGTGTPYYVEGSSAKSRFSITGGYLYRIMKPLYGYVGGGYGQRTMAWETIGGEWVKNIDHSVSGLATEIGLIGKYKRCAFSLGVQTLNFKYMELGVGVGFFF